MGSNYYPEIYDTVFKYFGSKTDNYGKKGKNNTKQNKIETRQTQLG